MLAHSQGELLDQSKLAGALGISGQTVGRYIDLLCDLMLVRRLPAWRGNTGKHLVRAPKVSDESVGGCQPAGITSNRPVDPAGYA